MTLQQGTQDPIGHLAVYIVHSSPWATLCGACDRWGGELLMSKVT